MSRIAAQECSDGFQPVESSRERLEPRSGNAIRASSIQSQKRTHIPPRQFRYTGDYTISRKTNGSKQAALPRMLNIMQRLLCLLTAITMITVTVAATTDAAAWRTVALTGHSADSAGGDPLTFTQMGLATLNQHGQIALAASAQAAGQAAAGGVWSEADGQGLRLLAFDGRPSPGVSGGVYTGISETYPLINDAGQVAFRARLVTGGAITSTNNSGVWIADAGQTPTLVMREGDSAPGAPSGAVFDDHTSVVGQRFSVFNDLGQVATQATLRIGTGGVTGNSDFGIWRTGGGPTRVVGLEASPAPGTTLYYGNISGSPRMNDLGQAMFLAPLKNTPGSTTNSGTSIWFGDPAAGMTMLVRDGQTAPGAGGATFNVLGGFSLNNASEYVLVANLNIGGSVTSQNDAGLWTARGGNPMSLFVREADHAPGTNAADGFATFSSLRLNAQGRIAFQGTVTVIPGQSDPGLTTSNDAGIWSEGASGLELIARENDPAPGVPTGVLFDFFSAPAMNATGRLAFTADLRGAGVTTANNTGLWAQDDNGALTLLAREGDAFDVDDGPGIDMRTVSQIGFWSDGAGQDGARTGLNEVGQLVFSAAFTDSSTGVFVVDLRATLPGDFNKDDQVDTADYVIWRKGLNTIYTPDHYTTWRSHFGQTAASGSATIATAAVPEPALHVLLLAASLAMAHVLARPARC